MPAATFLYCFSVAPDQRAPFAEWARATGIPFWMSRPGLRSYRTYRVQVGTGASMAIAEFESAEALARVLDSPEWTQILTDFQSFLSALQSWVLAPGPTGDQPLTPGRPSAS